VGQSSMKEPRMLFGFLWLILTAILILIVAIGHVEEKTSFGMGVLVTGWIMAGDRWSRATFEKSPEKSDKQD